MKNRGLGHFYADGFKYTFAVKNREVGIRYITTLHCTLSKKKTR